MFLRRYTRTKDGKQHSYYALVESVRTDAGPRQQVVAYLGELNHDQQRRWQRTVVFHNRQGEAQQLRLFPDDDTVPLSDDPDVVRIRLNSVGWTNGRRFGDVWLARWLWHHLHLDEILARHLPQGKHTVAPADIMAIEVINRLCAPCSEFALAEHWYAASALPDLLGVSDDAVTKDRLYRTLDALLQAQQAIEDDLKEQLGTLFQLDYDLLLYDLTSTYFEGLAEDNDLARRGYSRDHRSDCKQVVIALVVTRDGFPLAHLTLAGNTQDGAPVKRIVLAIEKRFGQSQRVWVMDRGMISKQTLRFLGQRQRRYLLATRRSELARFQAELGRGGWQRLPDNPEVEVKPLRRGKVHYLLARSKPRRQKERAMRRRQRRGLAQALKKLHAQIAAGRLKKRDKVIERVGRLKGRYPKGCPFVTITVASRGRPQVNWSWKVEKFKAALAADGAYLLRSNQDGWSAQEFWETYIQLTVVEHAFRVLKSNLRLRPVWHQYSRRVQAHVLVCVLAYALWKTRDHLAKQAGLQTLIHKSDPCYGQAQPKPRPMTPEVILRELGQIQIGDIHLETTDGQQLVLRRVARPNAEQARILAALQLELPERLSPDHLL
ncbi:MAG TPA: IS1634 family transposase [Gemmataceae bacterium]|nr:IS1634 family transposase [Gemmataceae bacterium]